MAAPVRRSPAAFGLSGPRLSVAADAFRTACAGQRGHAVWTGRQRTGACTGTSTSIATAVSRQPRRCLTSEASAADAKTDGSVFPAPARPPPPPPPPPTPSAAFPDFKPRAVYEPSTGVPRSYFLGHHRAALDRMRRVLATVGLVIECRDLRVPLTAWNPLLESSLMGTGVATESEAGGGGTAGTGAGIHSTSLPGLSGPVRAADKPLLASSSAVTGRSRIVVYTKRDLVVDGQPPSSSLSPTQADLNRLANFHGGDADAVVFIGSDTKNETKQKGSSSLPSSSSSSSSRREASKLLAAVRAAARRHGDQSLTGLRALIVGMPNAGKSTLLNKLRARGMMDASRRSKAAATGSQPGVTRKLGTPVRVLDEDDPDLQDSSGGGVLVMDTPGVFVPYVSDAESMLKLALVGCVREGLVPPVALADYLLFQLNKRDPSLYTRLFGLAAPTEDVLALLDAVARRIGKLGRGGVPAHEAAAQHFVTAWRRGKLGAFCLDALDADALAAARSAAQQGPPLSMNQARKREKERRKARQVARHTGGGGGGGGDTGTAAGSV